MTVAVVEDEAGVREAVSFALEEAGYTVSSFRDGAEAWAAWTDGLPDLVVLELKNPLASIAANCEMALTTRDDARREKLLTRARPDVIPVV